MNYHKYCLHCKKVLHDEELKYDMCCDCNDMYTAVENTEKIVRIEFLNAILKKHGCKLLSKEEAGNGYINKGDN